MSFHNEFLRQVSRHARIVKGLPPQQITEGLGNPTTVTSCGASDCLNYDPNALSNCIKDKITIGSQGICKSFVTQDMSGSVEGTKEQIGGVDKSPARRKK